MRNDLLAVNEIFGPTIQGEGVNIGMPVMFLRMAGCNQACVWCDTRYAWDWTQYDPKKEVHKMTVKEVANKLLESDILNLVVSGGEPMLQQKNLRELFGLLHQMGWAHIEMETAGSITPIYDPSIHLYTVSVKLANSGNKKDLRINPEALKRFTTFPAVAFKFVVSDLQDFEEIDGLVREYNLSRIYIMPEGIEGSKINREAQTIAQATIKRGYYLTTRMQILLYGNQRAI